MLSSNIGGRLKFNHKMDQRVLRDGKYKINLLTSVGKKKGAKPPLFFRLKNCSLSSDPCPKMV